MSNKKYKIGARIDEELNQWIYQTARRNNVSISDIIVYALEAIKKQVELHDQIRTRNPFEKLMEEDNHLYIVVQNNGELKLERIEKGVVNFSEGADMFQNPS